MSTASQSSEHPPTARPTSGGAPAAPADLPKQYKPSDTEPVIRARWHTSRAFIADPTEVLSGRREGYAIVIPPPNVTDRLHLGHALNNTLQDILARAHRMKGYETLWMAGTDHAGIATQAVVERRVQKEEGKRKTDFTREAFVAKIQAFKDEYEATITEQLKAMGCSCDWDRQRFTMDPVCARAVREAFYRLFKDGLIYRGKRLVNWDPALQTAVADDETYDEEIDGQFYYLRYPLVHRNAPDSSGRSDAAPITWSELARRGYPGAEQHAPDDEAWITVATTRPETYLGDTAVAVNPHDPRARALRGLFVELPLVGRIIPILEDSYVVLPEALARTEEEKADPKAKFATGFLKVTPAHDQNDYELGRRHADTILASGNPGVINVMAPDGSISDKHGWTDVGGASVFLRLKREAARKKVVEEFKARGLLEAQKPYRHSVKHSDRSKAIIEPYLSDQWYVAVTDPRLAGAANRALISEQRAGSQGDPESSADGSLTFYPARYAKTYEQWHDGIRDWCISRQLWWGHRIPVWTATDRPANDVSAALAEFIQEDRVHVSSSADGRSTYVCVRTDDAQAAAALDRLGFVQDVDVLDTWFSSALWPMSTMGWPDPVAAGPEFTGLLQAFNPTDALCTAREIITLWVSRMVMFNRYFMPERWPAPKLGGDMGRGHGPAPFRDVFIHSVIQDGEGRKMSKSLGNGVDPLDIIATHGADAMRFTLCHMTTQTQDVRMPVEKDSATGRNTSRKFEFGRNFCNKLWNASRFALAILSSPEPEPQPGRTWAQLTLADRWMLGRLSRAIAEIDRALDEYQFSVYAQTLYDLLWRDFCDWYLEAIKPTVNADPKQRAVLRAVLDAILRLLHPVTPFITEAIWDRLRAVRGEAVPGLELPEPRGDRGGLLCVAGWPRATNALIDDAAIVEFEQLQSLVALIREARSQHMVAPKHKVTLHGPPELDAALRGVGVLVETLAVLDRVTSERPKPGAPVAIFTFMGKELSLSNLRDDAAPAGPGAPAASGGASSEKPRLEKLVADLEKEIGVLEGRLANPGYVDRAPPAMVKQTRDQLAKKQADRDAARAALERLS